MASIGREFWTGLLAAPLGGQWTGGLFVLYSNGFGPCPLATFTNYAWIMGSDTNTLTACDSLLFSKYSIRNYTADSAVKLCNLIENYSWKSVLTHTELKVFSVLRRRSWLPDICLMRQSKLNSHLFCLSWKIHYGDFTYFCNFKGPWPLSKLYRME